MFMGENFLHRRDGQEGLTIFASSLRQTQGNVSHCSPFLTNKCRRCCKGSRQVDNRTNPKWPMGNSRKTQKQVRICDNWRDYRSLSFPSRRSSRNDKKNISALRLLVRTVHGCDPDLQSSSILTGELIRQFERIRIIEAKTEPARRRARASIRSYVVQARSLVAQRKMRFYEDINLPNLDAFRNERVEMPKRSKPRALDTGVIAAINAAAPKLASTDPAVYVAFLMFSRLGLRNVEIRNARWSWIENGRIGIIERPEENFYPKGSEGWVPIAPDVLKELMRFRNLSTNDYIVPGVTATDRKEAVDRRHSAWVGQWIKDRSKTSYELRRYAGSLVYNATRDILKVRDFLRHASVETTQQWYAYLLDDVPSIGMNDFVPALRVQQ